MSIAIVLGMWQSGLGITRSLAREGIEVHGIGLQLEAIALYSKYCTRHLVLPDPDINPGEYLEGLIQLGKNLNDKPVLFPTTDRYVEFISKYEPVLSGHFLFNIPEALILKSLLSKSKQYQIVKKLGIPAPKTISPQHISDLEEGNLSFPVVIKGDNSYRWFDEFYKKGFIVNTCDDLRHYYELATSKNIGVVVQEIVTGSNANQYEVYAYYSKQKQLLAIYSTHKIRQFPVDLGSASYMVSEYHPELISLSRNLFEGIRYSGLGSIELKKDDRDGEWKFIEFNPRLGQQNILALVAGINFPYINYLDCIGEKVSPVYSFKDNIHWADTVQDFRSFLAQGKDRKISFLQWLISIASADCYAHFSKDDLQPFWKYLIWTIGRVIKKLYTKLIASQQRV